MALSAIAACSRGQTSAPAAQVESSPPALTSGAPLLAESFDGVRPLEAWKEVDGASEGVGPASTIALDDGGVRLEGAADTRRWRALERTTALAGATWIRVSARTRTDGLVPDGVHHASCYVYTRFVDASGRRVGELVATRAVLGTTPWTSVARRFPVPAGATDVTVGLFLALPGRAWFDDVRVDGASAPDWHEATAGHYRYRWLGGDTIPDNARAFNTESFRLAAEFLGVDAAGTPGTVDYFKYPSKAMKEELMGDPGNALTLPDGSIHSIFATDRHEIVHVLARPWGNPPALLGEGLAVYLSGDWQGMPVTTYAKGLVDRGWVGLGDLLETSAFRSRPDLTTYAIAGAFVAWLMAQPDGKVRLRVLCGKIAPSASAADSRRTIEEALGATVEQLDTKLRDWLRAT